MISLPPLPALPRAAGSDPGLVSPESWNQLLDYLRQMERRMNLLVPQPSGDVGFNAGPGGFTAHLKRRYASTDTIGPFTPRFKKTGETYVCTVTAGEVIDHVTSNADAIVALPCPNQFTAGVLTQFDIEPGQVVYVSYGVLATGAVGRASGDVVSILVDDPGLASVHYAPPIEGDAGNPGEINLALAKFEVDAEDGTFIVTPYAMGDNVHHYRELSQFHATGYTTGVARLHTRFNPAADWHEYRGIKGNAPITVEETGTGTSALIEISLDESYPETFPGAGLDFNVKLLGVQLYTDGEDITFGPPSVLATWFIRNGAFAAPDLAVVDAYNIIAQLSGGSTSTPDVFEDNTE